MLDHTARQLPFQRNHLGRLAIWLAIAGATLVFWIASDLLVPASLAPISSQLQGFATLFLGIFIEGFAFLLAGVLVSSAIHLFVSPERVQQLSPRSPVV